MKENGTVKLSIADNMDDRLFGRLENYPVDEIYGKLPSDVVGGGRASILLPSIGARAFQRRVRQAAEKGIAYNYLLNAACLDNRGITRAGQKKIRALLDWVVSIGVTRVTVANAFLLRMIKKTYPRLHVRISVFAGVDHVRKAKMWEEMGADCVTLDSILVNREFATLRAIREAVSMDLQLLVNNSCMSSCHLSPEHMNFLAHASQHGHHTGGFSLDYCYTYCSRMKLSDPVNHVRADWIRPEDLWRYERMGYTNFKITERNAPTSVLETRVRAYTERRYDGNLLDLTQPFSYPASGNGEKAPGPSVFRALFAFARPWKANPLKLAPLGKLARRRNMLEPRKGPAPVVVDNRALDGFIERFEKTGCRDVDCDKCRHCHEWAERAVTYNDDYRTGCLDLYGRVEELLETGSLWRYGSR